MTENHELNTPPKGAQDWNVPLNENFEMIDGKLEVRDVESSRDDYRPIQGAKFLSTDTESEYLGDGSNWVELASSGRRPVFDTVRSRSYRSDLAAQNQQARSQRPLISSDNRTVYVDPDEGDNEVATENVSQDNPLRTLNEAFERVPLIVQHEWVIHLEDGTYDSHQFLSGPVTTLSGWDTAGVVPMFRIEGNRSSPENVVIDSDVNLAVVSAEIDDSPDAVLNSVQVNGELNNKAGTLSVGNCRFTGSLDGTSAAIRGKGDGVTHFIDCTFDAGLEYVARLSNPGSDVLLTQCRGDVSEYTFRLAGGARGIDRGDNEPIGRKGMFIIGDGGTFIDRGGNTRDKRTQLVDDFNDDRWSSNRLSTSFVAHRPEWNDEGGSIEAVDGLLLFPAGDRRRQRAKNRDSHENLTNSVTFDYRLRSRPSSGEFSMYWMRKDGGDFYRVRLGTGSTLSLDKAIGGDATNGVVRGNRTDDTTRHTVEVTRTEGGTWELFEDGTSQGTATDTDIPSRGRYDWNIVLENTFDEAVEFDNLRLGQFTA